MRRSCCPIEREGEEGNCEMLKWVAMEEKDEDKGDDFREIGELGGGVEKKWGLKRCKCVSGWCMKRVLKWIIPPNAINNKQMNLHSHCL